MSKFLYEIIYYVLEEVWRVGLSYEGVVWGLMNIFVKVMQRDRFILNEGDHFEEEAVIVWFSVAELDLPLALFIRILETAIVDSTPSH